MKQLNVVILAAGKGERMLSKKPKVMHEIMGKPMIGYAVELAKGLLSSNIVVVTGFGREKVEKYLKGYGVNCSVQTEQKGTAHAVLSTENLLNGGDILVLYGDVPLIESSTLDNFLSFCAKFNSIAFLTTEVDDPSGYGRVRMEKDEIIDIVEDADATPEEKGIKEINTGICMIPENCFPLLGMIEPNNKKGEFYLTDICRAARNKGQSVKGFHYPNPTEVLGINSRKELLEANLVMRDRILERHLRKGVTLLGKNIYIEEGVKIGKDTTIFPDSYILGNTVIGEDVTIGPNTIIKDSNIGNNVHIEGFVFIQGAHVKKGTGIEPFSQIIPSTTKAKEKKLCAG